MLPGGLMPLCKLLYVYSVVAPLAGKVITPEDRKTLMTYDQFEYGERLGWFKTTYIGVVNGFCSYRIQLADWVIEQLRQEDDFETLHWRRICVML